MQIGHCLRYFSQFLVGFIVGFLSVWQLTLVTLAVVPLIAIAGGTYAAVISTLSTKGEAAYAEAGKIAEEVIFQVFFGKLYQLFSEHLVEFVLACQLCELLCTIHIPFAFIHKLRPNSG
jgi:ABC-type multidrug transport system fused ATPase/permease subunit